MRKNIPKMSKRRSGSVGEEEKREEKRWWRDEEAGVWKEVD